MRCGRSELSGSPLERAPYVKGQKDVVLVVRRPETLADQAKRRTTPAPHVVQPMRKRASRHGCFPSSERSTGLYLETWYSWQLDEPPDDQAEADPSRPAAAVQLSGGTAEPHQGWKPQ